MVVVDSVNEGELGKIKTITGEEFVPLLLRDGHGGLKKGSEEERDVYGFK